MDSLDEALVLIKFEAFAAEGIVSLVRFWTAPTLDRMERLRQSLERVARESHGWKTIDRELACCLYLLSAYVESVLAPHLGAGGKWADTGLADALIQNTEQIEAIFGVYDDQIGAGV